MFYSIEAEATHGHWLTKTTARTIVNIRGKKSQFETQGGRGEGEGEGEGEEVERAEEPAPHATLVVGA